MSKYKISVKVQISESNDDVSELKKQDDGSFEMTINEVDAISIDKCEKAVLETSYESIRQAVSAHLEEISKKKPGTNKKRRVDRK